MRRVLSVLGNLLLAIGVVLMIPFVILLLGFPIAAAVTLVTFVAERL